MDGFILPKTIPHLQRLTAQGTPVLWTLERKHLLFAVNLFTQHGLLLGKYTLLCGAPYLDVTKDLKSYDFIQIFDGSWSKPPLRLV